MKQGLRIGSKGFGGLGFGGLGFSYEEIKHRLGRDDTNPSPKTFNSKKTKSETPKTLLNPETRKSGPLRRYTKLAGCR